MQKILYVNYYVDANALRQNEIDKCLLLNIKNPLIDSIVVLLEQGTNLPAFLEGVKVIPMAISKRPTYNDFFNAANRLNKPDAIHIISNSDIIFSDSLNLLDDSLGNNSCFALTRWDIDAKGDPQFFDHDGSQDIWIFKGIIKNIEGNFNLGIPGCDNRIAFEIEKAGYKIYNPSLDIITFHLHSSGIRNYSTGKNDVIPKPYKLLPATDINFKKPIVKESSYKVSDKKRVLHIALNSCGKPQAALVRALKSMGEYVEIDWMAIRDKEGIPYLRNHIIDIDRDFKPDLVFMQIQTPGIIDGVVAGQLGGFVVNWTGDVRQPIPQWYYDVGKEIDLTCFSNETDVEVFKKAGLRAAFLNIGFDETIFRPEGPVYKSAPEIIFLGSHYVDAFPLSKFRFDMVKRLYEIYGKRFQVFGNGWDPIFKARMLNEQEEATVYRSCKIAINVSHFKLERYFSDRMLRIIGSGAYCLSHQYPGIHKDWDNSRIGVFNDIDGLIQLINQGLSSEHDRKFSSKISTEIAHNFHTWNYRIKQLKDLIGWEQELKSVRSNKMHASL